MCLWLCEHAWLKDDDGESGSTSLGAWRVLCWFIFYLFIAFVNGVVYFCIVGLHSKYFIGVVKYHIAVISSFFVEKSVLKLLLVFDYFTFIDCLEF